MYGFFGTPPINSAISVTEWVGSERSGSGNQYKAYSVPRNATFLYVVLIGAGGDGGGATPGVAQFGGGGGGAGAITKAILPCFLLPSVLYVRVEGASAGNGSAIAIQPLEDPLYKVIQSRQAGVGGTGGATGTAGAAAVALQVADCRWQGSLALWVSQAGVAGGAGSATNGAAVTALATLPLSGGGGGGGSSGGTGGAVTGDGIFPTIAGAATGHNPGNSGMILKQPLGAVGGSGGGGVNGAGTGLSIGGNGAIGCGGGGGGNCASGTAGAGGNGGPGYCMIVAF